MHMLEQVSVLQGVHPRVIIKSFRKATQLAVVKIKDLAVRIGDKGRNFPSFMTAL